MIDPTARIGSGVTLDGVNPDLVSVGRYSLVGTNSALLAHCPIRGACPCIVGEFCWLGYGVTVLPRVVIGDHCVIGAGSVVTNSIPAHSIAAGNPARVLRELTPAEEQYLSERLLNQLPMGKDDANA